MENEIPFSQEKSSKAVRLREAGRKLRESPLDRALSGAEWEAVTGDLTQDDLDHLRKMARGHRDRALDRTPGTETEDILEEARSAVLLWPQDQAWAREVAAGVRGLGLTGPEVTAFFLALNRRTGRNRRSKVPGWVIPAAVLAVALPFGVWASVALWPGMNLGAPVTRVQGPRTLETVFDTQGVKTNIQVSQNKLLIFPEATVAELAAWVVFPDHRVDVWEGTVSILDSQGQTLDHRDVVFHPSSQGPLEPGQGVAVFEQFDAWPYLDRVASFQVVTTKILAVEAHPLQRKQMPLTGADALTPGYNLKVWILGDQWTDRFASKVHNLSLELENTGLKPFAQLQLALVWRGDQGKVLKTLEFRPVSPFRMALPPGGRLSWKQETVFDTEVFSWVPGQEPYPVLELRQWQ